LRKERKNRAKSALPSTSFICTRLISLTEFRGTAKLKAASVRLARQLTLQADVSRRPTRRRNKALFPAQLSFSAFGSHTARVLRFPFRFDTIGYGHDYSRRCIATFSTCFGTSLRVPLVDSASISCFLLRPHGLSISVNEMSSWESASEIRAHRQLDPARRTFNALTDAPNEASSTDVLLSILPSGMHAGARPCRAVSPVSRTMREGLSASKAAWPTASHESLSTSSALKSRARPDV
jgi:hypothetical protein